MAFQSSNCLFWGFYVWILSGSLLSGLQHRRSLDSPGSQLSNHSKSCPDCKAPVFDKPLQNQTVVEGVKAQFKCYVSGNPKPDVSWYKNGKIIRNSGSFVIITRDWGSRLKIRVVELSDAGTYTCVANNSLGTVRIQALLIVNESIKPTTSQDTATPENRSPSPTDPLPTRRTTTSSSTKDILPKYSKQANPQHSGLDQGKEKPTTNDLEIATPPALPENGSCVIYNGSVCSKYLKGQPIYVKSYERLENFEIKLRNAYNNLRPSFKDISEQCGPFVKPLLCHYQFPSCDKTSPVPKPRQICYEECETLRDKICKKEYIQAEGAFLLEVLFPECSKLPRRSTKKGKSCIKLGVNEPLETQKSVEQQKKVLALPFTGCYTGNGQNFRANVSVTEKGLVCQRWNSSNPHHHILSAKDYPELAGGHNFCRNPGGKKEKPWCFTTDADTKFDFCDIPSCEDPSAMSPKIQVVSILYTIIPCMVFAILFSLVVIFVLWRYHKQIIYQASQSAATPLVPVVGKPTYPKIKEMRRETVRFLKDLGEGEFGKLYKGEVLEKVEGEQTTRAILAKVLRNSSTASNREGFLRQAETWSKFSHPNIISVIGMCYNGPPTCILYECVEYGTLYDYLVENSPLESPVDDDDDPETLSCYELLQIAIEVAAGMNYLSQHNYIHGDLAARNCMVGPRMTVKITDIALSRNPFSDNYHRSPNFPPMPLRWMAPEGILNYRFTTETDIWSFGVVLWEIFSFGCRPHHGFTDEEVMERIREHVLLPSPTDCPPRIFVLMKECWDILPPSRPRFSTIYTHLCTLRWDSNGPRPAHDTYDRECFHVDV